MRARLALLGLLVAVSCDSAPDAPNVLLIVVDTLRQDRLGCYGYERDTSPNLDELAASGTLYRRAYSLASWTTPSIGGLMTSQFPSTLGIRQERSVLPESVGTVAEVFREHGYHTAAVISHTFCSAQWNFDRGFESFNEDNILGHHGISSKGVTDRALELLQTHVDEHADRPLFLWTHYFDPHSDYFEHEGFTFPSEVEYEGPIESGLPRKRLMRLKRSGDLRQEDWDRLGRIYDSEIAFTDHHIGRLLDGMKRHGLYDDTLVLLTADHGEEFNDHLELGHTKTLYREVIHVPLIIRYPGSEPAVVEHPVSLLDGAPTLLEGAGLPVPPGFQGQGLRGRSSEDLLSQPLFSETTRYRNLRSVILGRYKLILNLRTGGEKLFHLGEDPLEKSDIKQERPKEAQALRTILKTWMNNTKEGTPAITDVPPELEEHLRSLGYLGQ